MGKKSSSKIQGLTKAQKQEVVRAKKSLPPPAGIKFVKERKLSESSLKTSILILSRVLPADQQKIVEKALEGE